MIQGLEKIALLLRLYKIREGRYTSSLRTEPFPGRNFSFEDAVLKLYYNILGFQARLISHLWKPPVKRAARNTVKADDWKGWLDQVEQSDAECLLYTDLLNKEELQLAWQKQYSQADIQISIQQEILQALDFNRRERREYRNQKQCQDLLQSLSTDYEEHKNFNPRRVPGTCEWFLNSAAFLEWRNASTSRILWVFAGPGCGKSVLSRCLIDERRVSKSVIASTVCYFLFKDGQEGRQTCANALKAITHQILRWHPAPNLIEYALPRFAANGQKFGMMFGELWSNLIETLQDPATGEVVCVLDALDECTEVERKKLLEQLIEFYSVSGLQKYPNIKLKILITSRPYHDIGTRFARLEGAATFLQLDGEDYYDEISQEIDLVIDYQVPVVASSLNKDSQGKIAQHLRTMDHRTYLWLHLMLDVIEDKIVGYGTEAALKAIISQLPGSINEAYEQILNQSKEPYIARKILLIVLAAKRALTVSEMNVALALTSQETCSSLKSLDRSPDDAFRMRVKQLCGLFVSIYDHKVYLIHQTARDFLLCQDDVTSMGWRSSMRLGEGHGMIFRICVVFLGLSEFEDPPYEDTGVDFIFRDVLDEEFGSWQDDHIFFRYATMHWIEHYHLMLEGSDDGLVEAGLRLCDVSAMRYRTWWPLYKYEYGPMSDEYDLMSDLGAASAIGWLTVVEQLLDNEVAIDFIDDFGRSGLWWACLFGKEAVARLLLARGAAFNRNDPLSNLTPELNIASRVGHEAIVQLLLEYQANVNLNHKVHGTALSKASLNGKDSIVKLLIANGADVNAIIPIDVNALIMAAISERKSTVRLLLEHGARFCKDDWADVEGLSDALRSRLDEAFEEVKDKNREDTIKILLWSDVFLRWDESELDGTDSSYEEGDESD